MLAVSETMKKMRDIHLNIDPNFKANAPNPEVLAQCKFVLVRHAVTEFNMEFARVAGEHGFESE